MREIRKQRSRYWDDELYEELFDDMEERAPLTRVAHSPRSSVRCSAEDRARRRAVKRYRQQKLGLQ